MADVESQPFVVRIENGLMNATELRDALAALVARYDADQVPIPPPPPPPPIDPVFVVSSTDDLQHVVNQAPDGAILDLGGFTFTRGTLTLARPVTLRNGTIQAQPNVNDLINITGPNVTLLDLTVRGDGTTKRGIACNGSNMLFERIQVRNIRRAGQESNAVAIWNGTGLTVRDSVLEGGSQAFLAGGASPAIPNHIPSDLLFERVEFTRPLLWRGQGFACKTGFELKSARRVTVRHSIIQNVWSEGQTGIAITITPSQYGNSPENIVEDVLFQHNSIGNVGGGASLLGFTQHMSDPLRQTLRGRNYRFVENSWHISKAFGGQAALMQIGWEPELVEFVGNTILSDGDAMIRVTDRRPINGFKVEGNTVRLPGTYGMFTPLGSRGVGFATLFPSGVIAGNTFVNAHATFRANFPNNTYVTE